MSDPVLIAADKFKGSLTASAVSEAVASGLRRVREDLDIRVVPVADGGDGTVLAALANGYRSVPVLVTGPLGDPVDAEIALHGDTAVVELAAASGLALLEPGEYAPLGASSDGTGELIRTALDAGASTVVLGVGGSACTDGGAGMLSALGARVLDEHGNPLPPGGEPLTRVSEVDLSELDSRIATTDFVLASDVDNQLTGESGAARVYAPQKGADARQVELLDAALARWSRALRAAIAPDAATPDVADAPSAGAAGGVGYAALAALGAEPRSGVEVLLELVGFADALAAARLVVTGEGSVDEQTLRGKAPAGVAAHATRAGVSTVAVAGRCALSAQRAREGGFAAVYALDEIEPDSERCMREGAQLLASLGERIGREWLSVPAA